MQTSFTGVLRSLLATLNGEASVIRLGLPTSFRGCRSWSSLCIHVEGCGHETHI